MAAGFQYHCDKCEFAFDAWSDGNPYVLGYGGKRHYFYHPNPPPPLEIIRLKELDSGIQPDDSTDDLGRISNAPDHLCLDCGAISKLDPEHDQLACRTCRDDRLVDAFEATGVTCPKCKTGVIERNDGPVMIS